MKTQLLKARKIYHAIAQEQFILAQYPVAATRCSLPPATVVMPHPGHINWMKMRFLKAREIYHAIAQEQFILAQYPVAASRCSLPPATVVMPHPGHVNWMEILRRR